MNQVLNKLNIKSSILTKKPPKEKVFNKYSVPPVANYNFQADLLHLPTTKDGYKYLLTVVDLANHKFDMQEMKTKSSKASLDAYKKILARNIIKMPKVSMRTDNGGEFKDEFHKFLTENKILHTFSLPHRHKQMAIVETLNKQVGYIFTLYMNQKEEETGEQFNEWNEIIDEVREELNDYREKDLPQYKDWDLKLFDPLIAGNPKFKIGDMVHYKLETPMNALNNRINDTKFRQGDYRYNPNPRKIIKVVYMADPPYFRYVLKDMNNVSYSENELIKSDAVEEKYFVERILEKRITKTNKVFYLIKWRNYPTSQSTWESEKDLLKDLGQKHLNELIKKMKKKK
jgi:hypothetical protein